MMKKSESKEGRESEKSFVLLSTSGILSLIGIAILLAPFAFLYVLNNGNPYERYWVEGKVPEHLEAQGIKIEDIEYQSAVAPKHLINNNFYHMHYVVVFKDEPKLEYLYGVKKWGKDVVQFCEKEQVEDGNHYIGTTTKKTKHSEETCAGIYENRD